MTYDVQELLNFIDVNSCDYQKWITVGMAIHSVDSSNEGLRIWDSWSSLDRRTARDGTSMYKSYGSKSCAEKWKTFGGSGITVATLIKFAKEAGFRPKDKNYRITKEKDRALADDAVINEPQIITNAAPVPKTLSPVKQLILYLETLFTPEEYVGYVTSSARIVDGRWVPDRGVFTKTVKEIVSGLKKNSGDLSKAIGQWHEECGAWIRINPLNGKGVKDSDVTALRYALIESDSEPVNVQREVYERIKLPIACLVNSGKKSLHAIVRVDAKNIAEYRERVDFLYARLEEEGLKPDHADRNPARLSRMPGVTRCGVTQSLEGINLGLRDFSEWKYFIETGKHPPKLRQPAYFTERPYRPPALIEGVLQYGHKMLIVGPSKAGKSFFAIELGICISEGKEFLGFKTSRSKVLYLNMEISEESFEERVWCVADKLGCLGDENFYSLSLRGAAKPIDKLVSDLIRDYKDSGFKCVILDPIYKVIPGDENSAEAMKKLTDQLDRLCNTLKCCVIYIHHHSKGAQGGKATLDRASGSGVLTRDADEVFDLTDVEVPSEVLTKRGLKEETTVWDLDITSRDFGRQLSKKIYFSYPLHSSDDKHFFDGYYARGSALSEMKRIRDMRSAAPDGSTKKRAKQREDNETEIDTVFDALEEEEMSVSKLAKILSGDPADENYISIFNAKKSMIYRVCNGSEKFIIHEGIVKRKNT